MTTAFAIAAATLFVGVALVCAFSIGFFACQRGMFARNRRAFGGINLALSELTPDELQAALRSSPDKIVGLLRAATRKREQAALNERARAAEFTTP